MTYVFIDGNDPGVDRSTAVCICTRIGIAQKITANTSGFR
jgi:hypothetical protein